MFWDKGEVRLTEFVTRARRSSRLALEVTLNYKLRSSPSQSERIFTLDVSWDKGCYVSLGQIRTYPYFGFEFLLVSQSLDSPLCLSLYVRSKLRA